MCQGLPVNPDWAPFRNSEMLFLPTFSKKKEEIPFSFIAFSHSSAIGISGTCEIGKIQVVNGELGPVPTPHGANIFRPPPPVDSSPYLWLWVPILSYFIHATIHSQQMPRRFDRVFPPHQIVFFFWPTPLQHPAAAATVAGDGEATPWWATQFYAPVLFSGRKDVQQRGRKSLRN